jgi:Rieske Fe-S protein
MERFVMIDLIYVLATLAFFGLMVAYVRACQHLGHSPSDQDQSGGEVR